MLLFLLSLIVLPKCYKDTACSDEVNSENGIKVDTAEDCCIGTDSGMAYKLKHERCNTCKGIFNKNILMLIVMVKFILIPVHGFQGAFYTVIEGDNITIQFTKEVKGRSLFPSPNLSGMILLNGTVGRLSF